MAEEAWHFSADNLDTGLSGLLVQLFSNTYIMGNGSGKLNKDFEMTRLHCVKARHIA